MEKKSLAIGLTILGIVLTLASKKAIEHKKLNV